MAGMDFTAAIRTESDRFYDLAEGAEPERRIPACPDWTVADLVWHLAEVHWFWASDVESRATDPAQLESRKPPRPEAFDELIAFGRGEVDHLIGALAGADDALRVWTWARDEADHCVGFVRRHQVQEAAVHRWDVEAAATGTPQPIDPEVAADSIDEILAMSLPWGITADKPLPGTVHLHCTDTDGEWLVSEPDAGGRLEVRREHAKGDAAVRGTASDLLLLLWKRVPLDDRFEVFGDDTVARRLIDRGAL